MNSVRLSFIFLSVLIGIIHCSVIVRRQVQNEIDPSESFRDNFGCDAAVDSCGTKGKCCDIHDACYKKYGCTASSWFYLWGDCHKCNTDVMECVVDLNPGKSSCCAKKNCGQPRS